MNITNAPERACYSQSMKASVPMYFTKEQRARIKQTFHSTTELTVFLRDELKLPATVAKSLAWQLFEESARAEMDYGENILNENVA